MHADGTPSQQTSRKPTRKIFIWDIRRLVPGLQNRKSWDIIRTIWDIKRLFSGTLLDILL